MRRSFVWATGAALALFAACGGRGQLEGFPGESETGSSGTGGAGGTGSSQVSSSADVSVSSSTSVASSVAVSSSSGGLECETSNDCQTCVDCAVNGPCFGPVNDCFSNNDCIDFNDCLQGCGGGDCFEQCAMMNPVGAQLYQAALECLLCDACPNVCGDSVPPGFCNEP